MAKEAFSASILEANLDSLKNKTSEVAKEFNALSSAAESFGVKFSQQVRTATGNIQGLKSALNSLESSIKRTTGTSSAVGAANISSSLGALTGQGRFARGGYGGSGGGGGGGGALSGSLFAGGSGGAIGLASGLAGSIGRGMSYAGGAAAAAGWPILGGAMAAGGGVVAGAASIGKKGAQLLSGMMMGAGRQSYALQGNMERIHRTSGLPQAFLGGAGMKQRYGWGDIGYSPTEAFSVMEMLSQTTGAGAAPGEGENLNEKRKGTGMLFAKRAQYLGMSPLDLAGPLATGRAAGYSRRGAMNFAGYVGAAADRAMTSLGTFGPGPPPGGWTKDRPEPRLRAEERVYRGGLMAQGMQSLMGMQGAVAGARPDELGRIGGLMGALTGKGGIYSEMAANQVAGALGRGTFSPGGGEGGALFAMRAGGFGNQNIRGYQQTALEMGIDPSKIKRRSFTEYLEWKEASVVDRIQSSLVGLQFENRGQPGMQALQMQAMYGKEGLSFTQAQQLVQLGQTGGLGDKNINALLGKDFGKGTEGALAPKALGPQAEYETALLGMRDGVTGLGEAVLNFQTVNIGGMTKGINDMAGAFRTLSGQVKEFKNIEKPYIEMAKWNIELIEKVVKFMKAFE